MYSQWSQSIWFEEQLLVMVITGAAIDAVSLNRMGVVVLID